MKTIGILGGMGPASTLLYYETLCTLARERLGGNTSAPVLLHAFDFGPMRALQIADDWDTITAQLIAAAKGLIASGAELILLATNTKHKVADALEAELSVPFLHIGDATADRLVADGRKRPALLGTRYTMEEDFYTARLSRRTGADIIVPCAADRDFIQDAIFNELVKGIITPATTDAFIAIAKRLKADGADSVILGCTEIGLVMNAENSPLPAYDTARIHCAAAIDFATGGGPSR